MEISSTEQSRLLMPAWQRDAIQHALRVVAAAIELDCAPATTQLVDRLLYARALLPGGPAAAQALLDLSERVRQIAVDAGCSCMLTVPGTRAEKRWMTASLRVVEAILATDAVLPVPVDQALQPMRTGCGRGPITARLLDHYCRQMGEDR